MTPTKLPQNKTNEVLQSIVASMVLIILAAGFMAVLNLIEGS